MNVSFKLCWFWLLSLTLCLSLTATSHAAPDDETETEESASDEGFGAGRGKEKGSDETKESADDESEEEADDEGFGSGRSKSRSRKVAPLNLEGNKDKERFVRALRRQFRKKDAFYVVTTLEQGFEEDPKAPPEATGRAAYKPYERITFEVLGGQDEAVAFIVEFMGEYDPPWEKKNRRRTSRRSRDEAPAPEGPPNPRRDWKILNAFPEEEIAYDFRNFRQNAFEQEKQRAEEVRKLRGQ